MLVRGRQSKVHEAVQINMGAVKLKLDLCVYVWGGEGEGEQIR